MQLEFAVDTIGLHFSPAYGFVPFFAVVNFFHNSFHPLKYLYDALQYKLLLLFEYRTLFTLYVPKAHAFCGQNV